MHIPIIGRKKFPKKIVVAVPTRGVCYTDWAYAFAATMTHTTLALQSLPDAELSAFECTGTYVMEERNDLVKRAIEQEMTAIVWMDDDMANFPPDSILRLLKRNEPIVGVNYSTRSVHAEPTAIKDRAQNVRLYSDGKSGLEEVEGIGFGLLLTYTKVFTDLGWPFFRHPYDEQLQRNVGEDVDWCERVRKLGYRVMVDHDLSHSIQHIGTFKYTEQHYAMYRDQFLPDLKKADLLEAEAKARVAAAAEAPKLIEVAS